jgi:hypothetical protein
MNLNLFIEQVKKLNMNEEQTLQYIYEYIRDQILFDFLPEIDDISAAEIFERRSGQCNNKTILFFEIIKELGYEARVHFSTIDKNIHRGLFPAPLFWLVPREIGHSWIDVKINGKLVKLDGYINDNTLFAGALRVNAAKNWDIGHSVAGSSCGASSAFSLKGDNFVQMDGVKKDLGSTTQPLEWLKSKENPNRVNFLKKMLYRLFLPLIRRRVRKVRQLALD